MKRLSSSHRVINLRAATDRDWVRAFGLPAPQCWMGLVADDGRLIHGIGGLVKQDNGLWVAWLRMTPGCRCPLLMHKAAREIVASAREAKLTIYALADRDISGSGQWLKRLGFYRTKRKVGGYKIWIQ